VHLIHIFEIRAQALNLCTSIFLFVDDSFLISQEKIYNTTLLEFYNSYKVVKDLMMSFGLVIEHDKSEIFHLSRVYNNSNLKLYLLAVSAHSYSQAQDILEILRLLF